MCPFAERARAVLRRLTPKGMDHFQQEQVANDLRADSVFTFNFGALLLASSAIATFGLLQNNAAVIIGAMIVAPLVMPMQALAFGAMNGDGRVFRNGATTIVLGTVLAVLVAGALSFALGIPSYGSEIVTRSKPTVLDLGIALAAGAVGGFARTRPAISSTAAGTAIAVALMPPLCVVGIALAHADAGLAYGSTLLYVTNLLGITLACMVVYWVAQVGVLRNARRAILTAVVLTIIVSVPLAASFVVLLKDARVEYALKHALLTNTQTFRRVELVKTDFNWLTEPPQVTLVVRSPSPITPGQVAALQDFARRKTGQSFMLIFEVTPLVEVTANPAKP